MSKQSVLVLILIMSLAPATGMWRTSAQSPLRRGTTGDHKPTPDHYSVARLTLPTVSTAMWESHPAIDPLTGDLWFVRSTPSFSGWRVFVSRCKGGVLQTAVASPFAASGIEADPFFSRSGMEFYYISSRSSGSDAGADLDIWHVTRTRGGKWLEPEKLPAPVNSSFAEWFPRPGADGSLYFGSGRPGGFGRNDIWRARLEPDGTWTVENAGPAINTAGEEYEFLPSADGSWALLSTDKGFYRVNRGPHGWELRFPLGGEINATGTEIGPMFLDTNDSFVFSRDSGDGESGELFVAYQGPVTDFPGACSSLQRAILQTIRGR